MFSHINPHRWCFSYWAPWHSTQPAFPLRRSCDVKVRTVVTITGASHLRQSEETSACCPARQQRPQRAKKSVTQSVPQSLTILFLSSAYFTVQCVCVVSCLAIKRGRWHQTGCKGWFFPDRFFVLSTQFVSISAKVFSPSVLIKAYELRFYQQVSIFLSCTEAKMHAYSGNSTPLYYQNLLCIQ